MTKIATDVLIIGAGPVGLFCANELLRHGLSCRIIDKKTTLSDKSKALGIHIRTMDVMEDCGFISTILNEGLKVDNIEFKSNRKKLANASFAGVEANRHFLIDLPQDRTEAILNEGLQGKGLQVEWQKELTTLSQNKDSISASIVHANGETETLTASWLIACDGAHSTVRHLMHEDFIGAAYKQNWWLADLKIGWDLPPDQMTIYLHEDGPLACFPMKNKRYRVVMTAPLGNTEEPTMEDIINAFLQRSSDSALLSHPLWITKFNLHHRHIEHYRKGRIFFAGDAAHIHSPMGGQGLNTGIQDVYNLVWKLALVEKKLAHEKLLDSYHAERYPVGLGVLKKTDIMTKLILLKNPLLLALRNTLMSMLLSFDFIKNKLATDMAGLAISYAKSSIVEKLGVQNGIKAGCFLSDFSLENTNKELRSLQDITQGTLHHLLLFTGRSSSSMRSIKTIVQFIEEKYALLIKVHIIFPHKPTALDVPATVWGDPKGYLHHRYKIEHSMTVLLRPDKYVGFTQTPVDLEGLKNYLARIFY